MSEKIAREKTYGEIIQLTKRDVIFGVRMESVVVMPKGNETTRDPNGKTLYIEVEVEANKNHEQSQAKWRNAFQASEGEIYVFCDNR